MNLLMRGNNTEDITDGKDIFNYFKEQNININELKHTNIIHDSTRLSDIFHKYQLKIGILGK